jgi:hypothetical protein
MTALGAVEESGEEAVAVEGCVGTPDHCRGSYAGKGAEAAIAEEVGGRGGAEDSGSSEVGQDGFEGGGGDAGAVGESGQDFGDNVLVFLRLERTCGIKEAASGGEAGESGGEDFTLAGGLAGEIGWEKALLYLWVTS